MSTTYVGTCICMCVGTYIIHVCVCVCDEADMTMYVDSD